MDERQEFLRSYLDELGYLRRMGKEFAHLYPKVAARSSWRTASAAIRTSSA
jgi:type VI protein secretion system component VasA